MKTDSILLKDYVRIEYTNSEPGFRRWTYVRLTEAELANYHTAIENILGSERMQKVASSTGTEAWLGRGGGGGRSW